MHNRQLDHDTCHSLSDVAWEGGVIFDSAGALWDQYRNMKQWRGQKLNNGKTRSGREGHTIL